MSTQTYTRMKDLAIDIQNAEKHGVEPKLDRSTLPKDGQKVLFQEEKSEEWMRGSFVEGDDLFFVSNTEWYLAFNVLKWYPIN